MRHTVSIAKPSWTEAALPLRRLSFPAAFLTVRQVDISKLVREALGAAVVSPPLHHLLALVGHRGRRRSRRVRVALPVVPHHDNDIRHAQPCTSESNSRNS